ncbi:hypothetical protein KIW84_071591 [Lathyrus oleraceus]|uniref:Uncharacterized protein n=1 Tax=Pisum sativum TaxID=3888 RepID=A0A9D4ZUZ6_PEA|nr:hypothetical protein KIW84_071591 [Pisum sativum]
MSPFEALYGCKPPTIPAYTCESTFISILDEALTIRDELMLSLKANMLQAQNRMSQKANSHRQNFAFAVGDKDFPPRSFDNQPVEQPVEILAYQTVLIHGKPCPQLLVQWTGSPANEASLEQVISFQACYPDFHLEDNVIFDGERNNTSLSVGISESNSEKEAIKKPGWMKDYMQVVKFLGYVGCT